MKYLVFSGEQNVTGKQLSYLGGNLRSSTAGELGTLLVMVVSAATGALIIF